MGNKKHASYDIVECAYYDPWEADEENNPGFLKQEEPGNRLLITKNYTGKGVSVG